MKKIGFDSDRYVKEQTRYILERVHASKGRLYIECGGKLLHDLHASRVLPGFDPNAKMKVFQSLKEHLDIIICMRCTALAVASARAIAALVLWMARS